MSRLAKWSSKVDWEDVMFADVDGDTRDDVIGRANNGDWWVGKSTGIDFETTRWGKWATHVKWTDTQTADFNGDGLADVAGRAVTDWWVGISDGEKFKNQRWDTWNDEVEWQNVQAADLNSDGQFDLVGRNDNEVIASISNGNGFTYQTWAELTPERNWNRLLVGQFQHEIGPPSGDFNDDGTIDAEDIDELCAAIRLSSNDLRYDLNEDQSVDKGDHGFLIDSVLGTQLGNSNLDDIIDTNDLVQVFVAGKYGTGEEAGWSDGDWNCDGVFDSEDLVAAFTQGSFSE